MLRINILVGTLFVKRDAVIAQCVLYTCYKRLEVIVILSFLAVKGIISGTTKRKIHFEYNYDSSNYETHCLTFERV